jgi:hypothetical protein
MLPIALIIATAQISVVGARPPACLVSGTRSAALIGTIGVSTADGDPARGKPAYRYATLTLDRPICLRDPATGAASAIRIVALVDSGANVTLPFRFKGDHARVIGRLELTRARDAPLPARLYRPTILPDED